MLQGKVAGVQIAQSGSGMGGSTRIIMRGLNSLSGKNQPLWVIDGIPINDDSNGDADEYGGTDLASAASQINPEDIESISILKGANAAALYGSRAQSGAIIITTKKGKQGQPLQLEYNGNIQFSKVYNPYDYQNIYGQGPVGYSVLQPKVAGVRKWKVRWLTTGKMSSMAIQIMVNMHCFHKMTTSRNSTIPAYNIQTL